MSNNPHIRPEVIQWHTGAFPEGGTLQHIAIRFHGDSDSRRIVLIAGIHGDETTPIFVLRQLHHGLSECRSASTVDIIPVVNPLGLLLGRRDYPIAGNNLNRVLDEPIVDEEGHELMRSLAEFCRGSDLVIDLHSWDAPSALLGVTHRHPSERGEAIAALCRFGCDFIWVVVGEQEFSGTLGGFLTREDVQHCAIELPNPWHLTPSVVDALSERLLRAIGSGNAPLPHFGKRREMVRAPRFGLFEPFTAPAQQLSNKQPLGRIFAAQYLDKEDVIVSPACGVLLHISEYRYVRRGDVVAIVGIPE